jgi:hypothetical protein
MVAMIEDSGIMDFENNWVVPVLHDGPALKSLIDPFLKMEMLIVTPRQEPSEMIRDIRISYDPAIRADALVKKMSAEELDPTFFRHLSADRMKIVRSEERRKIVDFEFDAGFYPERGDDPENFLIRLCSSSLRGAASLIAKADLPFASANPFSFIFHCFNYGVQMRGWDRAASYESGRGAAVSQIMFLVEPEVAVELQPYASREFGESIDGYQLFAKRGVLK